MLFTECAEVACGMPYLPRGSTFDNAVKYVRSVMPDESYTVVDNVAAILCVQSRDYHEMVEQYNESGKD